ncbi:hypothetical protein V1477_008494 [Vespula maculifrons]|uniref:Uncharacterized protein n=1 Tax=Vespula maculifrons TaxID=7453 RepID=A0ABD2CDW6_VESMC
MVLIKWSGGDTLPRVKRYKAAAFDSGMKRGGGDGLPLGGDIRRLPLTVGPVMPRISTIHI